MGKKKAAPPPVSEEELIRRHARALLLIGAIRQVVVLGIIASAVVACCYVTFYLPIKVAHGETTTINVAQRWLAQVDASVWVAWGTTGAVMGYAWRVRQKWKQERQQKDARIAELEKQIDPGRTSSEVTQEGDPKKGDKA
jgi:hypothetical protein